MPEALVDVTTNAFGYSISFYERDQVGATNASGYYTYTGEPFVEYEVVNPNGTNGYHQLDLVEMRGGSSTTSRYEWVAAQENWFLIEGNGSRIETVEEEENVETRTVTRTTMDASSNIVSRTEKIFAPSSGRLLKDTVDPDGADLERTLTYSSGKLKRITMPDGRWTETLSRDAEGRPTRRASSWLDKDISGEGWEAKQEVLTYTNALAGEQYCDNDARPRIVEEKIEGQLVAKTFHRWTQENGKLVHIVERAATTTATFGAAGNRRTKTTYDEGGAGPPSSDVLSVEHVDGRLDSYQYQTGTFYASNAPGESTFSPGGGDDKRTIVTHGTTNSTDGVAWKTTRDVTIADKLGRTRMSETYVYDGSSFHRISWRFNEYSDIGQLLKTTYSDGRIQESEWGCCGKDSETTAEGIVHQFLYDSLNRMDMRIKVADTNIYTEYTYDAAGRNIVEERYAAGLYEVRSNFYDIAGRITNSIDASGLVTTYRYANGGRTATTIAPGPVTNVTERYLDGQTKWTRINGTLDKYYTYGVNADGSRWTKVYSGPDGTNSASWSKTTTDMLGRTVREERPGFGGTVITNASFYNTIGQLTRRTATGKPDTLYEYDALGNQVRSAMDLDGDGIIDLAGPDRVNENRSWYEQDASNDFWQVTASILYPYENDATPLTNSLRRTRLTGLGDSGDDGILTAQAVSVDALGNATTQATYTDRTNKKSTRRIDRPDSSLDDIQVSENGLLQSTRTSRGITTTYAYDPLERRVLVQTISGQSSNRVVRTTTHYNTRGQVDYTQDAATNRTSFVYSQETGRQIAVSNALGQVTRYGYDNRGRVIRVWGDAVYPVSKTFDAFGRNTSMTTYRDEPIVGSWAASTWPSNPGTGDTTVWAYEEATGLLTNKTYADGNGTAYEYTSDGKLSKRTWARGVTTEYSYSVLTGEMTNINYSGSTPDISFTYTRIGRQKTITDAQGTRTFYYSPITLQLTNETIAACGVTNVIVRSYDSQGRGTGFSLDDNYSVVYGYSDLGRFSTLDSMVMGATNHFAYNHLVGSDLLAGVSNSAGFSSQRSYEPSRNLITAVENKSGTNLTSRYEYQNDALGRRTQRLDASFPSFPSVQTNQFVYNTRSELTNALMGAESFGYAFDSIGNREVYTTNATEYAYTVNALNQYTNITGGAGAPRTPTYDLDGNMLTHAAWTYTWSDENRMIQASNDSHVITYHYDYQGRMFEKVCETGGVAVTNTYIWDDFNIIAEITPSATNFNVWGLDLSGTLQGAGGIGGLLCVTVAGGVDPGTYFPTFDANGNVHQYLDTNGTAVATREYSPFGVTTLLTGSKQADFTHWWSTKPWDPVTELSEYEYRKYLPELGRWGSTDPLGEAGGVNLYSYVGNGPVANWDLLGWTEVQKEWDGSATLTMRDNGRTLTSLDLSINASFTAVADVDSSACASELLAQVAVDRTNTDREKWNLAASSYSWPEKIPRASFDGQEWFYPNMLSVMVYGLAGDRRDDGLIILTKSELSTGNGQVYPKFAGTGDWDSPEGASRPPRFNGTAREDYLRNAANNTLVHKIISREVTASVRGCPLSGITTLWVFYGDTSNFTTELAGDAWAILQLEWSVDGDGAMRFDELTESTEAVPSTWSRTVRPVSE